MITIALVTLALALVGAASAAVPSPSAGKLYHGVYPGGITGEEDAIAPADLSSYQATVHKTAAWVYCSDNWYRSRSFPLATATWIRDAGSVPFIRLMLLDSAARKPNKRFTLAHVPRGDFDADFRTWGRAAQAFDTPLIVEFRDRGEQLLVPVERQPAHDTDMRVQDNPRLADAFRTLVGANANVLGRVGH